MRVTQFGKGQQPVTMGQKAVARPVPETDDRPQRPIALPVSDLDAAPLTGKLAATLRYSWLAPAD